MLGLNQEIYITARSICTLKILGEGQPFIDLCCVNGAAEIPPATLATRWGDASAAAFPFPGTHPRGGFAPHPGTTRTSVFPDPRLLFGRVEKSPRCPWGAWVMGHLAAEVGGGVGALLLSVFRCLRRQILTDGEWVWDPFAESQSLGLPRGRSLHQWRSLGKENHRIIKVGKDL